MRKLIFVLVSFLINCSQSTSVNEIKKTNNIYYFKDDRTGICFAAQGYVHGNNFSFTEVPCEKVPEHLLVK